MDLRQTLNRNPKMINAWKIELADEAHALQELFDRVAELDATRWSPSYSLKDSRSWKQKDALERLMTDNDLIAKSFVYKRLCRGLRASKIFSGLLQHTRHGLGIGSSSMDRQRWLVEQALL